MGGTCDVPSDLIDPPAAGVDSSDAHARHWRVVVRSIGSAGAGIVTALRQVLPWSEEQIAARLYHAPSELLGEVDLRTADAVAAALRGAGLDVDVQRRDVPFEPGKPEHDVALVIQDFTRVIDVVREIAVLLGVDVGQAKRIACASPAELIGKISASTVEALRERFAPLGASLDVSRMAGALYDIFLVPCTAEERSRAERRLNAAGYALHAESHLSGHPAVVCAGLSKPDAERAWSLLKPSGAPLRIINRDFQRFDLRLDGAPDTPGMVRFLVSTAGMPEHVARKVSSHTPIVVHHNVGYDDAGRLLAGAAEVGATMSAHLLALQRFQLHLAKVSDARSTSQLLELFAGLKPEEAREAARSGGTIDPRVSLPQARWLALQLKRAGTDARLMVL